MPKLNIEIEPTADEALIAGEPVPVDTIEITRNLTVPASLLPVLRATLNEAAFGHVTPEHTQQLFALVAQIDEMS